MAVAPAPQPVATGPTPQPMVARSTARTVRKDINVYRADQWDAMMRSRDLTMLATAFAAIGAYALLVVVAVYGRIPFSMVVAATVFLVVGGVVGLTHQVYLQVGQQSVVEDFGLSVARMLANPLVSGLVALIAVATFGTAGLKINDAVIVKPLSDWHQVFNFTANSGAIVVAVLFGFAPSLLFQWLQSRADQLQKNLQNTQSTGSTTP